MYAIIADGGRQYKVTEGQELAVDYRDLKQGDSVTFDRVLAVGEGEGMKFGTPTVAGAKVVGEVLGTGQGPKVDVQKIRRRKNSRRHTGHRKMLTRVRVTEVAG